MIRATALCLLLAGCADALGTTGPRLPVERPLEPALYSALPAGHTRYSHDSLADLFVRLTLESEWGAARKGLVRYEVPVVVGLEGRGASAHAPFLDSYLSYLRSRTGIDITRSAAGVNLFVRVVPGRRFASVLPAASCVLVPGDRAWGDFEDDPARFGGDAMMALTRIEATTVFLPDSLSPADVRRCLVEEIAQALGPQNDLYGVGPSIFNDDFGHIWPTRLDLLVLRVLYSDALATGLGEGETRRRVRSELARANAAGRGAPDLPPPAFRGEREWRRHTAVAHDSRERASERLVAAALALELAEAAAPRTAWHCTSLTVLAQLLKRVEPDAARVRFAAAEALCARVHGADDPRIAQIRLAAAGLLLSQAEMLDALAMLEGQDRVLAGHGQDEALAAFYTLTARAYRGLGEETLAAGASVAARRWSDYAFGRSGASFARLD